MLETIEKSTIDPIIAKLLDDLRREVSSGDIAYIAVVTVDGDGNSTRRLYGSANLATVLGALEAAKALVLADLMAECEFRPTQVN